MDFDKYAEGYDEMLRKQQLFFATDRAYFHERKVAQLKQVAPTSVLNVLDYGCGTGGATRCLGRAFPNAVVTGYDPSNESLAAARRLIPEVRFIGKDEIIKRHYDIVYMACVLHHVPPIQWVELLRSASVLLRAGGILAIFEHNPWNPVTKKLVRECPFDADAVLLTQSQLVRVCREAGLTVKAKGFYLYLPERLRRRCRFERCLRRIPLGGQHYVIGRCELDLDDQGC